mmetsp:Transcript_13159/g.21355  ORF Transcript_13159/g.21355 Transcript_13159/m.21355 type:complete len:955 (-) Transcript_13159:75-2939(-)
MALEDHQAGEVIAADDGDADVKIKMELALDMDGQVGAPSPVSLKEHFSLKGCASTIRYRNKCVQVIQSKNRQLILEQSNEKCRDGPSPVSVKETHVNPPGSSLLRIVHVVLALLCFGFVFAFGVAVIFYLFLSIATQFPSTSQDGNGVGYAICMIFGIPIFVQSVVAAITISMGLVSDAWDRFRFFYTIGYWDQVLSEWVLFIIVIFTPVFTVAVTLLTGDSGWWHTSALVLFFVFFVTFLVYAVSVVFINCATSILLLREHVQSPDASYLSTLRIGILTCERFWYSIYEYRHFVVETSYDFDIYNTEKAPERISHGFWSSLVRFCCCHQRKPQDSEERRSANSCFFDFPGTEKRMFNSFEYRGVLPFFSENQWSLEQLWCSTKKSFPVNVVKGRGALRQPQLFSSIVCSYISSALILLVVIGVLVYFQVYIAASVVVAVLVALALTPHLVRLMKLFRTNLKTSPQNDPDGVSLTKYKFVEIARVGEAKEWVCWVIFALEVSILFILPFSTLLYVQNYKLSGLFVLMGALTGARHYFSITTVLKEFGPDGMEGVGDGLGNIMRTSKTNGVASNDRKIKRQQRVDLILTRISKHGTRDMLLVVFFVLVVIAMMMFVATNFTNSFEGEVESPTFLPDFSYAPSKTMQYPSCTTTAHFLPANASRDLVNLVDIAFLAYVAYQTDPTLLQNELNSWFGPGNAVLESNLTKIFRESYQSSHAIYHLIRFPSVGVDVVAIRGTVSAWDMFADLQLWMAAALMQVLRLFLPLGSIWTTILSDLVYYLSLLESTSLEKVSYYLETTRFIRALDSYNEANAPNNTVLVTGHSLGGGLAIISGAQTQKPTIALSGVNAMLSRRTFNPPITEDQLNKYTFNIIPERDLIPMIDDVAMLSQNINCRAPFNSIFGCHTALRSVCEILYTCGTQSRPALCECARQYGYPQPTQVGGNQTFNQACPKSE